MEQLHVVFDSYDWIDPDEAVAVAKAKGWVLDGLTVYLYGSPYSLCGTGSNGLPALMANRQEWLERMTQLGLGVIVNFELGADEADTGGASLGAQRGHLIVACMLAAKAPAHAGVFASNDSVITNWTNVLGYFQALAKVLLAANDDPDLYGQSSLFVTLKADKDGYSLLWKAPDGTNDQPGGTCMVQGGMVQVGAAACDVDTVVAPDLGAWNLNGLLYNPGDDEMHLKTLLPGVNDFLVFELVAALEHLGYNDALERRHLPKLVLPPEPAPMVYSSDVENAVRLFREFNKVSPGSAFGQDCWAKLGELLSAG